MTDPQRFAASRSRSPDEGAAVEADWPVEPSWSLFHDNQSIWRTVFEQCDAAESSIDLEQYIFAPRGVGQELLDLLAAKARQGVAIRVLADGLGSFGLDRTEAAGALLRSGGRIAMFNGPGRIARNPIACASRIHRKTLILDGARMMVGGSCFEDRMSSWRDTMILLDGPLPPAVPSEFERTWQGLRSSQENGSAPRDVSRPPGTGWTYAFSGPGSCAQCDLREAVPALIGGAERSVDVTTPYLVPGPRLWRALTRAAARGVRVRVLVPARSDHRLIDAVGKRFAQALARHGVQVRGYEEGMIHAKILLADEKLSLVGSFNLDLLSSRVNLESGVLSTSSGLHDELADRMEMDWRRSTRL